MTDSVDRPQTWTDAVQVAAARPVEALATELIETAFGLSALVYEVVLRSVGTSTAGTRPAAAPEPLASVGDAVFGVAWVTARTTGRVVGAVVSSAQPLVDLALDPPLVPHRLRPIGAVRWFQQEWQSERPRALRTAQRFTTSASPELAGAAVDLLPVELVVDRVIQRVDVERIVNDAVTHIDLTLVVANVVEQLDLDALISDVVSQLDLQPVINDVLARVDLQPVVTDVVAQLDLQPVVTDVVTRLDLQPVVTDVLSRIDLAQIVVEQVDLEKIVNAALDELDLTALVKERVNLIDLADYVVEGIDLQEIIRESTGSIASETVKSVRLQSADADESINKLVDRLLLRRKGRKTETRGTGLSDDIAPTDEPATDATQNDEEDSE